MAIQHKFISEIDGESYLQVECSVVSKEFHLSGIYNGKEVVFSFDIETAVKFNKLTRIAISKIKSSNNG